MDTLALGLGHLPDILGDEVHRGLGVLSRPLRLDQVALEACGQGI
jgi:hypothetical protein